MSSLSQGLCNFPCREERLVAFFEHATTRIRVWSEASAAAEGRLGENHHEVNS